MNFPRSFAFLTVSLIGLSPGSLDAQNTYATPYTFTTLAGAVRAAGSVDGQGTAARFNTPEAVVVDSGGFLFVADYGNHSIRLVSPTALVITIAGTGVAGATSTQFNQPSGIAIDSNNLVYVADKGNHAIRRISPSNVITTFAGALGVSGTTNAIGTAAKFNSPAGVAVDASNNVYVGDTQNHAIRKITPSGDVTTFAGVVGSQGFVDSASGVPRFKNPTGLAVDAAGNVYVADTGNHAIRKITPSGVVSTLAGAGTSGSADGTGTAAKFFVPQGVAVNAAGNVFVADTGNEIMRIISPAGVVTTIGGAPSAFGTVDGSGSAARLESPYGVTVDAAGVIYVVEAGGNVVRKGVPPGPAPSAVKIPAITVPALVPAGASVVEARSFVEQPGGGVIVALSGSYATRPTGAVASAQVAPTYTNPQPYNLSYVVRLLANGQPDPAFTSAPGGDGTVNSIAVQGDGKIVVGGSFTTFNGVLFRNLARLQPDGKADATFVLGSGADAQVNAVALQADGKVLVGGAFQNFAGASRPYLLRLNANGAIDTAFSPGLNGTVNTIAVQADGKIVVGGNFTTVGGTARNRLARLLATGALDSGFDPGAGANDEVVALALQSDGKIIAGGDFTSFAGQTRGRIVRLLATGGIDPAFAAAATADKTILSVALQADGSLLLGGSFTQVNGAARTRLARLNADGTLDPAFDPGAGPNKDVRTLLPRSDGTVFLGGLFDQYQGAAVNEVVALVATPVATSFGRAPASLVANVGGTARFLAEATGAGALNYQWFKDGAPISGATAATLTLPNVTAANQGGYTLQVTSATGSATTSVAATLTVVSGLPSQIINLSVLTSLDATSPKFTLGFVLGGTGTSGAKPLLVRAGGPSLASFGVGNPLADPQLQFFAGDTLAGQNDNWGGTAALTTLTAQVGAFAFLAANSKDAAFAPTQTAAANSVIVSSALDGGAGAVIAEVYDATPAASLTATTPRLLNVSVLKNIPAGSTLTAGFVIRGNTTKTVLIRAVGPTLSGFGIGDAMADPKLTLFQGDGTAIATNDNWNGTDSLKAAFNGVGAFALQATTKDAALLVNLAPGSYTAAATSAQAGAAGSAIVEVYEVP